jgi:hypothetical protein
MVKNYTDRGIKSYSFFALWYQFEHFAKEYAAAPGEIPGAACSFCVVDG